MVDEDVRKVATNRIIGIMIVEIIKLPTIELEWDYDTDRTTNRHYLHLILIMLKIRFPLVYADIINQFNIDESNYQMTIDVEFALLLKLKNKCKLISTEQSTLISNALAKEINYLIQTYNELNNF